MTQYGFYFDSSRCTGCKTCELACKDYKDLDQTTAFRVVYDYEGGSFSGSGNQLSQDVFSYHVSRACNHCDEPACLVACPSGAFSKDSDTGLMVIDEEVCIGFQACINACPYKAPRFNKETEKARKCDGCINRVKQNLKPICVEACPLRALEFDDIDVLRSKYGDNASIAPLPTPDETMPNLVVKMAPATKPSGDTIGILANPKEVD
ncbi:MAG: dimethylsulfoxide reductase subunit B [Coriobacteriales bacterium]|jgi:DMSO reductase iron-sulfur subunit|nr:dimethylsulfoxide reductase subunit B [Coriobacteriales bacterium]